MIIIIYSEFIYVLNNITTNILVSRISYELYFAVTWYMSRTVICAQWLTGSVDRMQTGA
jgi:hypothetical protein